MVNWCVWRDLQGMVLSSVARVHEPDVLSVRVHIERQLHTADQSGVVCEPGPLELFPVHRTRHRPRALLFVHYSYYYNVEHCSIRIHYGIRTEYSVYTSAYDYDGLSTARSGTAIFRIPGIGNYQSIWLLHSFALLLSYVSRPLSLPLVLSMRLRPNYSAYE